MKWSSVLHFLTSVVGIVGVLAFLGAWIAGSETILGITQEHLFNDAIILMLIAIWLALGNIFHKRQETK